MSEETICPSTPSPRGFAGMDGKKQRAIASKGGKIAHLKRTAHEFSVEEARRAGHLGGLSVSKDRAHMAAIGRQGGKARRNKAQPASLVANFADLGPKNQDS